MTFLRNVIQFTGLFTGVVIGSLGMNMLLGGGGRRQNYSNENI